MKVCNDIKRRIDEADQPDQLGLEITQHTALCAACRAFADERAALRRVVAAGARVSAPMNFDAMLNARLAEVKTRRSFAWFSPAVYLRFGAATAGIVLMVIVAQYTNLFSKSAPDNGKVAATQLAPVPSDKKAEPANLLPSQPPQPYVRVVPETPPRSNVVVAAVNPGRGSRYAAGRGARVASASVAPDGSISLNDGGVVIMRGQNGEREIPMPTVSVGAQPLLYVNAGRQPQTARTVSTSF